MALASILLQAPAPCLGQPSPGAGDAAGQPERHPPRVIELPAVVIPDGAVLPNEDHLTATIIVDPQGHATLEQSGATGPMRRALEEALQAARFEPARVAGEPVTARVQVALEVVAGPTAPRPTRSPRTPDRGEAPPRASPEDTPASVSPEDAPASVSPDDTPASVSPEDAPDSDSPEDAPDPAGPDGSALTYGATGRAPKARANERRLLLSEMRDLPGAFGDPFRAIEALPGIVPALSGLPYVYVRGAPPAGTVYYYDEIPLPALFHLGVLNAVIHPAMVGDIGFYPGVAPARYGRRTGGVVAAGTTPASPETSGELELRAIDVGGMLSVPVANGGNVSIAGRYGYPGLILSALSPDAVLAYWDYQARMRIPLGARDSFELVWLGSYDRAGERSEEGGLASIQALTLEFHRVESRWRRRIGNQELGAALQLGFDRSEEGGVYARSFRFGPRMWLSGHSEQGIRYRVGADMIGIAGHIRPDSEQLYTELDNPLYTGVAARNMAGLYGELELPLGREVSLEAGLRGDLWLTGDRPQPAVEPRAVLTWRPNAALDLHAAAGLAHQPAVFLLPLPGISDVALDHGLQRAIQTEAGIGWNLPEGFRAEAQVYWHHFTNMIFPELVLNAIDCDALPDVDFSEAPVLCEGANRFPRANATSYGSELLLKRDAGERFSGWISYTLGWARAHSERGFDFVPIFDVRHVANLVLQARLGAGWETGIRLHYRTGRIAAFTYTRPTPMRYEQRLPSFFRADAQIAYAWKTGWGRMRVALEWLNLTLAQEAIEMDCRQGVREGRDPIASSTPCPVEYAPSIFFPNFSVRGSF